MRESEPRQCADRGLLRPCWALLGRQLQVLKIFDLEAADVPAAVVVKPARLAVVEHAGRDQVTREIPMTLTRRRAGSAWSVATALTGLCGLGVGARDGHAGESGGVPVVRADLLRRTGR